MSLTELTAWIEAHDIVLWWVMAGSAALSIGTFLSLPWVVSRIPDDYFATKERLPISETSQHPVLRWMFRIGRNLLGVILLLLGIIMSPGPGPGLIVILAGMLLTEFPGKRRLELAIVRREAIRRNIDKLRARFHKAPLILETPSDAPHQGDIVDS